MTRIGSLERRDWRNGVSDVATQLTDLLRQPTGTQRLRDVQAAALWEAYTQQGGFYHIRVGGGKTLISALLPVVLEAKRPMLLVPASLVGKTLEDFETYRRHWKIPYTIRIVSYSKLGTAQHADLIDAYQPDLIIADEGHKLRHIGTQGRRSAVASRVERYLTSNPSCRFVVMSGTLTKGSILDYAHLLRWSLRDRAPVPIDPLALQEWSGILDAKVEPTVDVAPLVPHVGPVYDVPSARDAFQQRLESSRGVIISRDSFNETPLTFRTIEIPVPAEVQPYLDKLYDLWRAPDDWDLADARFEVWRVARQLGLGFCYVHDPRPPEDWFGTRRAWCRFVRQVLEGSTQYDSEFQVASACERGDLPRHLWDAWQKIKPSFVPNTVPLWFSDEVVFRAGQWGMQEPGIVWIEHTAFGERLSAATGWQYYREGGRAANGAFIEQEKGDRTILASIEANSTGRNLQQFNRSLVPSPLNQGPAWEQLIGREHRDGQTKPVHVDTFVIVQENRSSLDNARREANYIRQTVGQEQKLLMAERLR